MGWRSLVPRITQYLGIGKTVGGSRWSNIEIQKMNMSQEEKLPILASTSTSCTMHIVRYMLYGTERYNEASNWWVRHWYWYWHTKIQFNSSHNGTSHKLQGESCGHK